MDKKPLIKIERKIKKKKKNKLSAGLKTAIGVLGGLAATTGLINKAPAGKVNVTEQKKTESKAGGENTVSEKTLKALGVDEAKAGFWETATDIATGGISAVTRNNPDLEGPVLAAVGGDPILGPAILSNYASGSVFEHNLDGGATSTSATREQVNAIGSQILGRDWQIDDGWWNEHQGKSLSFFAAMIAGTPEAKEVA
ncbi:MAG: hypothetical protein UU87_C0003G0214, partial [Parcubacteria group bacterium GW2011_GWA2_42_11]